jgi:hypothetical protein
MIHLTFVKYLQIKTIFAFSAYNHRRYNNNPIDMGVLATRLRATHINPRKKIKFRLIKGLVKKIRPALNNKKLITIIAEHLTGL